MSQVKRARAATVEEIPVGRPRQEAVPILFRDDGLAGSCSQRCCEEEPANIAMAAFWWGEVAKPPCFHAHSSVMMVVAEGKATATALLLQQKERASVCTVHPNRP